MNYGLRKGLEDIAHELKGIRNILASMWHSRYSNDETDVLSPEAYADEYVSTEECARRLGISDQTLRNWMALDVDHLLTVGLMVFTTLIFVRTLPRKQ